MPRTTRAITSASATPVTPPGVRAAEDDALEALSDLEDDAFVEIQIERPRKAFARVPAGYLRRYLSAQSVPGRQVLIFDSDEEVSSQVAADMLGVSRPHFNELLEVEAIPYRRVGNQRRIRVIDVMAFKERRDQGASALQKVSEIANQSAGGWNS